MPISRQILSRARKIEFLKLWMLNMAAVDYNAEKGILSNIVLYFNGIILKITIIKFSNVLVYYLHFRSENLLCNSLQCYCIRRMPY